MNSVDSKTNYKNALSQINYIKKASYSFDVIYMSLD